MKKTLVVNLIGGPGVGKSTLAAHIFALLKEQKVDCELITEFAKDLVWEQRSETFKDEVYVFAKQNHKLFRLNGKVNVVITDSPLIQVCFYGKGENELCALVKKEVNRYNNLNILLTRKTEYDSNGRNQTEEEARSIDNEMKSILDESKMNYEILPGESNTANIIVTKVLNWLKENK